MKKYLEQFFPCWEILSQEERQNVAEHSLSIHYEKGTMVHRSDQDCKGLMLIQNGQLRTFIVSEEGREVTLFRVKSKEVCALSASCLMDAFVFDVMMDALEDTDIILIPSGIMSTLIKKHMELELYLYKASTERFTDVMWMLQQILFFGADRRVAIFLWDECSATREDTICYTHDEIARLIGSAREVVTKVLKYFADEGIVSLGRGKITILKKEKLKKICSV